MSPQRVSRRFDPAIYEDPPDAIAVVNVFDHGRDTIVEVPIGEYFHDSEASKIILNKDERAKQMLSEAKEILLKSNGKKRPAAKSSQKASKQRSLKYEAPIAKDEPDALATVCVLDSDLDTVISVEIGYYFHERTAGTIILLDDAETKDLVENASEIILKKLIKYRPTDQKPGRKFVPANSYRLSNPGR